MLQAAPLWPHLRQTLASQKGSGGFSGYNHDPWIHFWEEDYDDKVDPATQTYIGQITKVTTASSGSLKMKDAAVAEIEKIKGTHLDPKLVDAFIDVMPDMLKIQKQYSD